MTKRYTADDFANAKFAEHPDGDTARAFPPTTAGARWSYGGAFVLSDEQMADEGWVPVPAKPQITESQYKLALDEERDPQYVYGFTAAMRLFGGEVIPDPEPTNLEKLLRIIGGFEIFDAEGREAAHQIAQILDNNNVIVKDN